MLFRSKVLFFDRILGPLSARALSEAETSTLQSIDPLFPGDFRVVYEKHFLDGGIDPETLLQDLMAEVEMRRQTRTRPIGGLRTGI